MNFFYLDADPQTNATYHVNDHVGKMAMEACQMLSTAHRLLDGKLSLALAPTGRLKKVWLLDGEGCVFKHIEKDEWGGLCMTLGCMVLAMPITLGQCGLEKVPPTIVLCGCTQRLCIKNTRFAIQENIKGGKHLTS